MNHQDTIRLMQIIGPPHKNASAPKHFSRANLDESALQNLLPLANKNKVSLLFLEKATTLCKNSRYLTFHYQTFLKKWKLAQQLVKDISTVLSNHDVDHVIFKTLEPFPFVKSDVDILFFSHEDITKAYRILQSRNLEFLGSGPYSITLHSKKHQMNIDLQIELSVSRLVYLDKSIMQKHVSETNVDGCSVPVLEPSASLLTVLSHSFYKEQIFTLSNYYSAVKEVSAMNKQQRNTMVVLAEELGVGVCAKIALGLIQLLTAVAFKTQIQSIAEVAQSISVNQLEEKTRQIGLGDFEKNMRLPYKYQPVSIALAFATKALKDPLMRLTMKAQLLNSILDAPTLLPSILRHAKRDTY